MDPPAAEDLPFEQPPPTGGRLPPPQRRQRGRTSRFLELTLHFTIFFVILSLLKLEPIARNSVQSHNINRIDLPLPNPSIGKSDFTTNQMPKECIRRDLSDFATSKIGNVHNSSSVPRTLRGSNCLFYRCNTNITDCDNTLPTNYDGPKPPCCSHILRDMARIFDEEMCALGLDYVTAFGTLLGFRREGRIIPWTIDNDYIIPSTDVANAMVLLWNASRTGMAHHFQGINRMCATPDFAGGELQKKWPRKVGRKLLYKSGLPYIDFYLGRKVNSTIFGQFDKCIHLQSDVFPTKRRLVYDGEFAQNFPANTDQLLRTFYGKNWMIPPDVKSSHGVAPSLVCPYGPSYNWLLCLYRRDELQVYY